MLLPQGSPQGKARREISSVAIIQKIRKITFFLFGSFLLFQDDLVFALDYECEDNTSLFGTHCGTVSKECDRREEKPESQDMDLWHFKGHFPTLESNPGHFSKSSKGRLRSSEAPLCNRIEEEHS